MYDQEQQYKVHGCTIKSTNVYNFVYPGEKCYCVQTVGTNRVIDTRSHKNKYKKVALSLCVVCIGFF